MNYEWENKAERNQAYFLMGLCWALFVLMIGFIAFTA